MKARASPRRDVYSLLVNIRRNREAKERFTDSLWTANAHKARNINLTIYAVYSKICIYKSYFFRGASQANNGGDEAAEGRALRQNTQYGNTHKRKREEIRAKLLLFRPLRRKNFINRKKTIEFLLYI